MPTLSELKSQLPLDPFAALMLRGEIQALPAIVHADEKIHAAMHGYWQNDHVLLLATNERVLMVDHNRTKEVMVVEFPYSADLYCRTPTPDSLVVGNEKQKLKIANALEDYVANMARVIKQKIKGEEIATTATYQTMQQPSESRFQPVSILRKGIEGFSQLFSNIKNADSQEPKELAAAAPPPPEKEPVEALMRQLRILVGLTPIKEEVARLVDVLQVEKLRREQGAKLPDRSLHMVFYGKPGTGKTTIARLLAKIFYAMGILSKGQLYETDRSGLVAGYTGQTALKTREVCEKALGGILFIDEAYALNTQDTYGPEALNTIIKFMEDHRDDFIVILAGYDEPMKALIESNPGLESRFNKQLYFPDYTPLELEDIYLLQLQSVGLKITPEAREKLRKGFEMAYEARDANFGNGRLARNIFEQSYENQASRLVKDGLSGANLQEITEADIPAVEAFKR